MAKTTRSTIEGIDEIQNFLKRLGVDAIKVAEEAMRLEAREVVEAAKRNLEANGSVDTGDLKKSLRVAKQRSRKRGVVTISAIAGSKKNRNKSKKIQKTDPFYATYVEFGTKNAKAKPFMRPAFDEVSAGIASRAQEQLNNAVESLAKKAAKKAKRAKK